MPYFLHSSPSFLSAAELGLCIVSIQKGFVLSEGIINCLTAGLTSLHVTAPYLSCRSQTGCIVFHLRHFDSLWVLLSPKARTGATLLLSSG